MASGGRRLSVEQEGRRLVEILGGRWGPNGGMCRCPAHDDRTPSLSVRPGSVRLLLHCFAGCDASAVLRALEAERLLEPAAAEALIFPQPGHERNRAALRIWEEAGSIAGTLAQAYLASRGIAAASTELRYHPRAAYGPSPFTKFQPALIAAVRDDNGLVAIHRTFIDRQGHGLAALASPRRGLGEGIETALSATALFDVRCWATLGTERFGLVALPADVRELVLFLDHDGGGRRAERLAREAFAHVPHIESHVPDRPGDDWNDGTRE
jgi:putative DNA primase/helicase